MNTYKIVYTFNDDLQRCFIEVTAESRAAAIERFKIHGAMIGLNYKIFSCRLVRCQIHEEAKSGVC
jgi:hypothetical protein